MKYSILECLKQKNFVPMSKKLLLSLLLFTSLFISERLFATHVVGGQLQYVRIGPGSMPNSSRYRIKLILYRDNNTNTFALANEVPIICRADVRFNSDGSVKSAIDETILGQRYGQNNVFIRDFTINDGSYLDTLTVRNGALVNNNNTGSNTFFTEAFDASINNDYGGAAGPTNSGDVSNSRLYPPSSIAGVFLTLPGYEFGSVPANYPTNQIIASNNASANPQNFGFIRKYVYNDNSSTVDTCTEARQFSLEIGEYTRVVDLPNVPGGWHLFFVLSARNAGIVNIERPLQSGYVVYTRIPDLAALDNVPNSYQLLNQAYATELGLTVLGLGNTFTYAGVGRGLIHNYLSTAPGSSNRDIIARMQNSSPQFESLPPTFVCQTTALLRNLGINQNKPNFSYKASEYDGDELEYTLVPSKMARYDSPQSPWVNATERGFTGYWRGGTTLIDGTTFNNGDPLYPTMPLGPPSFAPYPTNPNIATFNNVIYRSPYTAESPIGVFSAPGIGTLPGIFINPTTGETTYNPPIASQFVTSIRVREYRTIPGIGGAGVSNRVLMSEISRDYQFNVQQCPIKSEARIAFTQGCFRPNITPVPFTFAPLSPANDATLNLFWDFGIDRHTIIGSNLRRIAPNGTIVAGSTIGGVSSTSHIRFGVKTTTSAPNYTFTAPGTYFVKLVAQLESNNIERHNCSDSAFIAVNVSSIRSGYTVTGGPVCVNTPITFNPFATGTSTGFVTTSGTSLWTNPATNPIPQVLITTINGMGVVTTFLGEAWWMQPDGSRARIRPEEAQESKVVRVRYFFGKGQFIEFRRDKNGTTWPSVTGSSLATISRATISGTLFGPQSIPGVTFSYPDSIANAQSYLLVENQFGCKDSTFRSLTVVRQTPAAQIYTNNVCQNVSIVQVSGFITIAPRGIWSGGDGNYIQAGGTTTARATVTGVSSVVGGINGRFLSFTYRPTIAELSVSGFVIPMILTTSGISECPVGISTSAGITVTPRPFVDAGPPVVQLCRNNLEYMLNATISGGATQGIWTTRANGGTFLGSSMNTSTILGDIYRFSSNDISAGFAILTLTSTNHGLNGCLPVRDVITLTAGPLRDVPTIAGFTVNGISTTPYRVCANNSNFTIIGIVSNSGLGGLWSRTATSPGVGGSFITLPGVALPGTDVYRVSYIYFPSPADTLNGFVDLQLSTNVLPSPTQCNNVSRVVRVLINPSPRFNIVITSTNATSGTQVCTNNAEFTISGTVLGAGGFTISDGSFGGTFIRLTSISGTGFFASSFIYRPSASVLGIAESFAGGFSLPISFLSTNNGSCNAVPTARTLTFVRSPRAIISNAVAVNDTFKLCNNNANQTLNAQIFTTAILQWRTSGTGTFSAPAALSTLYTSSGADTLAGIIRVILEASNPTQGCRPTYDTAYVKYFNSPIINVGPNLSLCENNLVGTLTGSVSTPASGGLWSTNGTGTFASTNAATTTNLSDAYRASATDLFNGNVLLTLNSTGANIGTTSGQCLTRSRSINVGFTPAPVITFGPVPISNENNRNVTLTVTITGPNLTPSTTARWYGGLGGTFTPNQTTFTYNSVGPFITGTVVYTPSDADVAAQSATIFVSVAGANNCGPVSNSITFNIFPKPTAKISGNSVCANNSTITLNATVTGAAGGSWFGGANTFNVVSPGFSATYVPTTSEINQGFVDIKFTTTNEFNNAIPVRDSIRITITSPPAIALSALSSCLNSPTVAVPGSVTGAGGVVWTTSGSGTFSNYTVIGGNIATVYTPSALDKTSPTPIRLIANSILNGACNAVSNFANLSFTAAPVANAGAPQVVCVNDFPINLNASGSSSGSWSTTKTSGRFASTNTNTSTTRIDNFTFTTGALPELVTFTWTTDASTGCPAVTDNVVITVTAAPTVSIERPFETICGNNTSIALNATLTGATGGRWRTSGTGYFTSSSLAIGAVVNGLTPVDTYVFSATDITSGNVRLSLTGVNTSPCSPITAVKVITITPRLTGNAGPSLEYCSNVANVTLTGTVLANGVADNSRGGIWTVLGNGLGTFSNPNNRITVFTPTSAAKLNPPKSIVFSFTPTVSGALSLPCPTPQNSTVNISFRTEPSIRITTSSYEVCSDTTFMSMTATFSGTSAIVWSSTGTNAIANWQTSNTSTATDINSITTATVRYIPSSADLNRTILGFNIRSSGSGVCSDILDLNGGIVVTITQKPRIFIGGPATACENISLVSLTGTNMTVIGVARPTVQWYVANPSIGGTFNFPNTITTNSVGTVTGYFPSPTDVGNGFFTVFVSVTGPGSCRSQVLNKTINFTPAPTVNVGAPTNLICANTPVVTLTGSVTNTTLAGWTTTAIGTNIGTIGGLGAITTYRPGPQVASTSGILFTLTATLAGCNNVSATKTINLQVVPVVTLPSSFSFCGDNDVVTLSGAFSSTNSATLSNGSGTFVPDNITYSPIVFQPFVADRENAYRNNVPFIITVTSNNNGVCAPVRATTSLAFTPPPTISGGSNEILCSNTNAITLNNSTGVSASPTVLAVRWTTSAISTLSGGAGIFTVAGTSITSTNLNEVYRPGSIEKQGSPNGQTILTIYSTSVAGTCKNVQATKIITYNPVQTFAPLPNRQVCANNSQVSFSASQTNGGNILWRQSSFGLGGTGAIFDPTSYSTAYSSGAIDIAAGSVSITGSLSGVGACSNVVVQQTFKIDITPSPDIVLGTNPINICSEVSTVQLAATPTLTSTGLVWRNITNTLSGSLSPNNIAFNPIYSLTSADYTAGTIDFDVSVTGASPYCAPVHKTITVNITPRPTISGGADMIMCSDFALSNFVTLTYQGDNFTNAQWSSNGSGNFGNPALDVANPAPDDVRYFVSQNDALLGKISFTVRTLDQNGLCSAATDVVNLTLVSPPTLNAGTSRDYCRSVGVLTLSGTVSGTERYLYQWNAIQGNQTNGTFSGANTNIAGLVKTAPGIVGDFYSIGTDNEPNLVFGLVVSGTGICNSIYRDTVSYRLETIPTIIINEGNFNVCADASRINLSATATFDSPLASLATTWTAQNGVSTFADGNFQYIPSRFRPLDGTNTAYLEFFPTVADKNSTFVNFTVSGNGQSLCPMPTANNVVSIVSAPVISVTGPKLACSNNSVITVTGYSSTGAGSWRSASSPAIRGIMQNTTVASNSFGATIAGIYTISGDEFFSLSDVVLLFSTGNNGLCNQVTTSIGISLRNAPVLDAGSDGTICSLSALTLSGTMLPIVTQAGTSFGWSLVSFTGASTTLGSTLSSIVSTAGGNIQVVKSVYPSPGGPGTAMFTLTALGESCALVSDIVNYTFSGSTSLNAGSLPSTICGTDRIQLSPPSSSEQGVWTTLGAGYFLSTGAQSSSTMNDVYIADETDQGKLITFILSTIPGVTNGCVNGTPSTVTGFISPGIQANSGKSQEISVCFNINPVLSGTISGTSLARWRSYGTGFFASTTVPGPASNLTTTFTGNQIGTNTLTGAKIYQFGDVYVPSDDDRATLLNGIIIELESFLDAGTQCKTAVKDTLKILFTPPPSADAIGSVRDECINTALLNGISLTGIATLPSPNTQDPNLFGYNTAKWFIQRPLVTTVGYAPGFFESSRNNPANTLLGEGTFNDPITTLGTNVSYTKTDVYYPSAADVANPDNFPFLTLALKVGIVSIPGVNTITSIANDRCSDVISILNIRFSRPPLAQIPNTTALGICADQTEISLKGKIERALGVQWSTNGTGTLINDNTDIRYQLSNAEINTTVPSLLFFNFTTTGQDSRCLPEISNVVTVTVNPKPDISAGSDLNICADVPTITFNGINTITVAGSVPLAYRWLGGGNGTITSALSAAITQTVGAVNMPLVYSISTLDVGNGSIPFILSTTGPNTCKPITKTVNLNVFPAPSIIPNLRQEICNDFRSINVGATINNINTVQWVVYRINTDNTTVIGTGTLTGSSISSTNGTLTGLNLGSLTYSSSADDRNLGAELVFETRSLTYPNSAIPPCNQVTATQRVTLTPRPILSLFNAVTAICSDQVSIPLRGTVSGISGVSAQWSSTGFGLFNPSDFATQAELLSNNYNYFLDAQDRNLTSLGITLSVPQPGTCIDVYSTTSTVFITPATTVAAGGNDSLCADIASYRLINATQQNAASIQWITLGSGTFSTVTGLPLTVNPNLDPSAWVYNQSQADVSVGGVTLLLISQGGNPCTPDTSIVTLRYGTPPVISATGSGITELTMCSDNGVPLNASVDSRAQNWYWTATKPVFAGQQFSTAPGVAGVRGNVYTANDNMSPIDNTALNGFYYASGEDSLGVNGSNTHQIVRLQLVANGVGICSVRTFTSDVNVRFTPRPYVLLQTIPNLCTNDIRPITLTAYFLNTVSGFGNWVANGLNNDLKFSNTSSPNPPTTAIVTYTYDNNDKVQGLNFEFKPDLGTCKQELKPRQNTIISVRFNPGPRLDTLFRDPYCETVTTLSTINIPVNSVVGTGMFKTLGTGVFTSTNGATVNTTVVGTGPGGRTLILPGQNYTPSFNDIQAGFTKVKVYSTTQTDNCPPDSTKFTIRYDRDPVVDAKPDNVTYCAGDVITLSGLVTNHNSGFWSKVSSVPGGTFSPAVTIAGSTERTVLYTPSSQDREQSLLSFALSSVKTNACPAKTDRISINLEPIPTANAGSPSICTVTAIQLFGIAPNPTKKIEWTTTGVGSFSPSRFDSNAVYIPAQADLDLSTTGINLTLINYGRGSCKSTSSSTTLFLKRDPLPVANAGKDTIVCEAASFKLSVNGLRSDVSYQWYDISRTTIAGRNITEVVVTVSGAQRYILNVTDTRFGCTNNDTVQVRAIPVINLFDDYRVCYSDTLKMPRSFISITGGSFQWYRDSVILSGETEPNSIIRTGIDPGLYTLEYTEFGCPSRANIYVRPLPAPFTRGRVVCKGPVTLAPQVNVPGVVNDTLSYAWDLNYNVTFNGFDLNNPGLTPIDYGIKYRRQTYFVSDEQRDSAKYVVQITDNAFRLGCIAYDTVRIKTHPVPAIPLNNVYACIGDVVALDATPTNLVNPIYIKYPPSIRIDTFNASYSWTKRKIIAPKDTIYWKAVNRRPRIWVRNDSLGGGIYDVKFLIGQCEATDSSYVTFDAKPMVKNLDEVPYCIDEMKGVVLDAGGNPDTLKYQWLASGNTGKTEIVYDTVKYFVRISTLRGCSTIDSIQVAAACDPVVFLPDAFIPDGSNPNDQFYKLFGKYYDNIDFTVFNRWGEVVYFTKDKYFQWDGKFGSMNLPFGLYPYILKYEGNSKYTKGKKFEKRGGITIIR